MPVRTLIFSFLLLFCIDAFAQTAGISRNSGSRGRANNYVPDPPPDGCIGFNYTDTDYIGARAQSGSAGETLCISDTRLAGGFDYFASDPYGQGDDSTLVITASGGGFWVRDFAHSVGDPIKLDWLETISNNRNMTYWFTKMASGIGSPGSLYLTAPSSNASGVDTLLSDRIQWSTTYGITNFRYNESDKATVVKFSVAYGGGVTDAESIMWEFDNYVTVVIGGTSLNVTLLGNRSDVWGQYGEGGSRQDASGGIVDLYQGTTNGTLVDVRANIKNAAFTCINHAGGNNTAWRTTQMNIAGECDSGTIRINKGVKKLWMDSTNVVISDPYAHGLGWTGVGSTGSSTLYVKNRGVWLQQLDEVKGGFTLKYGWSHWYVDRTLAAGTSKTDPIYVRYKDIGYTGPTARTGYTAGVAPTPTPFSQAGKFDGHDKADEGDGYGLKFWRFETIAGDYGDDMGNLNGTTWNFATSNGNGVLASTYVYMEIGNHNASSKQNAIYQRTNSNPDTDPDLQIDVGDIVCCSFIKGIAGMSNTGWIMINDSDTLDSGTWGSVLVVQGEYKGTETVINGGARDILIRDLTVTGEIDVDPNSSNIVVEGVTFSASSQAVMTIGSGADVTVPTGAGNGLTSSGSGATITGTGSLTCNGSGVSLPYDFDTDTVCEY